jgi:hypothetical protein
METFGSGNEQTRRWQRVRVFLAAVCIGGLCSVWFAFLHHAAGAPPATAPAPASEEEAQAIATDAYVYGYPLVTMEMTRRVMTNVRTADGRRAPMGQFAKMRTFPDARFRDVTTPNADTLYTVAWLDLSSGPWVLGIPKMSGRYYLLPILDAWTEVVASPGTRTTGAGPGTFAITGPGFKGKLPGGLVEYRSPTNLVWIIGRIYSTGTPGDYADVHALQDEMSLVPLAAHRKSYTPPPGKVDPEVDMNTPVRDQVNRLDARQFFGMLAALMKANPPSAADAPMLEKMAKIGVVPGKDLDETRFAPVVAGGAEAVPGLAQARILQYGNRSGQIVNGWRMLSPTGRYGTDYLQRAYVSVVGLGANSPADAVYPVAEMDASGRPLDGTHRYVVHFDKGALPPVRAFWSLTLYDDQFFFVPNPLNRYNVGERTPLVANPDGSMDVYVQQSSPGAVEEPNWLPAPAGRFVLVLRLYFPSDKKPSILDGSWQPPPVRRAD